MSILLPDSTAGADALQSQKKPRLNSPATQDCPYGAIHNSFTAGNAMMPSSTQAPGPKPQARGDFLPVTVRAPVLLLTQDANLAEPLALPPSLQGSAGRAAGWLRQDLQHLLTAWPDAGPHNQPIRCRRDTLSRRHQGNPHARNGVGGICVRREGAGRSSSPFSQDLVQALHLPQQSAPSTEKVSHCHFQEQTPESY